LSDYLEYKGYLGTVEYSADDNLLCGEVIGIGKGLILYHGQTLDNLKRDFEYAIDHYLSCCEQEGKEPLRSSYGDINIKIPPDLHKKLQMYSKSRNVKSDEIITAAIKNYIAV
jgi:predicted HicB family RNase H-like nuclease